jgi:predicted nuclease with TOPRIM domain
MQTMTRESWTDERLDEFGKRMDERFDRSDERIKAARIETKQEFRRFDERFEQVDKRLDRLADGLESVQQALIFGSVTMSTAFVAGFVTLAIKI